MFGTNTLQISAVVFLVGLAAGGWFGYRYADNSASVRRLTEANKRAADQLSDALTRIVKEREAAEANARTAAWLQAQRETDAEVQREMQETINGIAKATDVCVWPPDVLERLQQLRAKSPH